MEKKRTENFTSAEEMRLLSCVEKYKHIVECKQTDAQTNLQKSEGWLNIAKEFNAGSVIARKAIVLKNKYKNVKKISKRKFADQKTKITGTGVEPSVEVKMNMNTADLKILEILGLENRLIPGLEPLESEFDDDSANEPTITNLNTIRPGTSDQPQPTISEIAKSEPIDPITIATFEFGSSSSSPEQAESKFWNQNSDRKLKQEEHTLRMQHMQERHDQLMRFAEEEHTVKLQILQQELLNKKRYIKYT